MDVDGSHHDGGRMGTHPRPSRNRPCRPLLDAPQDSSAPIPPHASFVGREDQLQILGGALEEAIAGRGSLLMLTGEAGVGKTRLAQEFAGRARARGVLVFRGSGLEGEWAPPFAPWVDILSEYARLAGPEALSGLLGPATPALAELVRRAPMSFMSLATTLSLSPQEERFRLYDSVVQLLMALAGKTPLLLILDDLQWADRDSLRLLRHVARFVCGARILILGAYREPELDMDGDGRLHEVLAVLQRESECRHLRVRGFNDAELAEYLARAAGQELPEGLVKAIQAETNGNPFYVRELLLHLADEGKLREPLLRDSSVKKLGVPRGVRLLVDRRLSRLSRDANSLLAMAAGFTGGFRLPEIQAVTGLPEEGVLDSLDEAIQTGFLQVVAETPPSYDFTHAIVRHALYGRLNPDRRARLHRRIALSLEKVYSGREMEHAMELAAQYHAAAALPGAERGIPFALEAAKRAQAAAAHERAVRFLAMASDLSAGSPASVRSPILCRRAIAEAEALMLDEAPGSVREAVAALSEAGAGPRARAEFLEEAARTLKDGCAGGALWEPLVEEGIALLESARDLLWARLALLRPCFEPGAGGEIAVPRWLGLDREAVEIARALGTEDDYARTLTVIDWDTREEADELLARARGWTSPRAKIRGIQIACDLSLRRGNFREAVERLDELQRVAERYGALAAQAEALGQMAMALTTLGEFDRALQCAQRAEQMVGRVGLALGQRLTQAGVAAMSAYTLGGDWAPLADVAGELARSPEVPESPYPMERSGLIAAAMAVYAWNRLGNRMEALRLLDALTPLAESLDDTTLGHNSGLVAVAGAAVWEMEAVQHAGAYSLMARRLIAAGAGVTAQGPHELTVARMACLLGRREEAREFFARSRVLVGERGMRPLEAVIDYDEALTLLRSGSADSQAVRALLDSARERFEALGMQEWAERAGALQGEVAKQGATPTPAPATRAGGQQARHSEGRGARESLTPRELEVAALVAKGLTNPEIASRLVISVRTAESHVENILGKLGFGTRAQIAVWAAGEGLTEAGAASRQEGRGGGGR